MAAKLWELHGLNEQRSAKCRALNVELFVLGLFADRNVPNSETTESGVRFAGQVPGARIDRRIGRYGKAYNCGCKNDPVDSDGPVFISKERKQGWQHCNLHAP